MWDLPRPGLEPVSPALAGRFSTTAPPGKSYPTFTNSYSVLRKHCDHPWESILSASGALSLVGWTGHFRTRNYKNNTGNSLAVQWLGPRAFTAEVVGSIPG